MAHIGTEKEKAENKYVINLFKAIFYFFYPQQRTLKEHQQRQIHFVVLNIEPFKNVKGNAHFIRFKDFYGMFKATKWRNKTVVVSP